MAAETYLDHANWFFAQRLTRKNHVALTFDEYDSFQEAVTKLNVSDIEIPYVPTLGDIETLEKTFGIGYAVAFMVWNTVVSDELQSAQGYDLTQEKRYLNSKIELYDTRDEIFQKYPELNPVLLQ